MRLCASLVCRSSLLVLRRQPGWFRVDFDDALVPQADAPKLKTYLREMRRIVAQERDRLRALQNNPDAK